MRTVRKYEVPVDGRDHEVKLPSGARIVHVDSHLLGIASFYAEVLNEREVRRTFRVFGTDEHISVAIGSTAPYRHVGSFFNRHGCFSVQHLYEKKND